MIEPNPLLRRVERNAVVACGVMAALAALLSSDRVAAALGVAAGGVLAWISYRGIKGGIDALAGGETSTGLTVGIGLVKFFTRYGILAIVAYVIMARVRLPPVAVIAGASSLVIAVTLEAGRSFRHNSPSSGDASKSRLR
jgi:hypothetical protein